MPLGRLVVSTAGARLLILAVIERAVQDYRKELRSKNPDVCAIEELFDWLILDAPVYFDWANVELDRQWWMGYVEEGCKKQNKNRKERAGNERKVRAITKERT
jgi:hypothetical protein